MKKGFCLITVMFLSVFGSAAWAADADATYKDATSGASTSLNCGAAKIASGDTLIGTITAIDCKAGSVTIDTQTVKIKPTDLACLKLRKGDKVKVTLSANMEIKRIMILDRQSLKQAADKQASKAKAKAVDATTQKALDKLSQ